MEAALSAAWGATVRVVISVGGSQRGGRDTTGPIPRPALKEPGDASDSAPPTRRGGATADTGSGRSDVDQGQVEEDEIDLNDLVDAPPESVLSPVDRLAQAFPGAELIDDPDR